jgi:hypothetical protein
MQENSAILYDVTAENGNDSTTFGDPAYMLVTDSDGIPSWNREKGFTLDTGVKIPALADGLGLAADGSTLTNPAGTTCNGSGTTTLQTDAALNTDPFWSNGAGTLLAKTQAEIEANNDDTDTTRSSINTPNVPDVLIYSVAPTGADLAQLNEYLASR